MKKKLVLRLLIVLFAGGLLLSGFHIVGGLVETAKTEEVYEGLQSQFVTPIAPPKDETNTESAKITEPAISVDFPALKKKNSDVIGWLYIPGTVVNYPVVQAEDNDKYLRRDLSLKKLTAGTLFADYRCKTAGEDANHIVYGHNMRNGTMFKTVTDYKKQSFYEENPVIYYFTPEIIYKLEPVIGIVIPDNDEIYAAAFSRAQMVEYIASKKDSSTITSSVSYSKEDSFVTLSTCSKEYENARFALICKISEVE